MIEYANVCGIEGDYIQLCKNIEIETGVLKSFEKVAEANNLEPIETIMRVAIVPEKFSVENGCCTNTQKLKRPEI